MKAFILTRQWRDTASGVDVDLWLSTDDGPVKLTIPQQKAIFFIRQVDVDRVKKLIPADLSVSGKNSADDAVSIQTVSLKNFHNQAVAAVYCHQYKHLRDLCAQLDNQRIDYWENDIRPPERFLMERFITGSLELPNHTVHKHSANAYSIARTEKVRAADYQPSLSVVSLDIETSMDASELYSIALYSHSPFGSDQASVAQEQVFMVTAEPEAINNNVVTGCINARACLLQFVAWIEEYDPDIIIGWHVVQFDFWVLTKLCEKWSVPLTIGRGRQRPYWRTDSRHILASDGQSNDKIVDNKRRYLQLPGRVVLDGIELLRTAFYHFDSFSLQSVASELLGDSKLLQQDDRGRAITDLFINDKPALAKYNVKDCQLVWDIFAKTNLLSFAVERSRLTGLPLDKMGGSVASFDYSYIPQLHRKGYIAPNLGELESDIVSPGGYVMRSLPGLYKNVLVLDFKSLYPSIIRSFHIDPYAFWLAEHQGLEHEETISGFNGARFSRKDYILPTVIDTLWQARDRAKKDNNQPLSQAIKIIMNSFYGVLGSTGCRFYDPRVCSSITLRGHDILQKTRDRIEEEGYRVIYGDTDSVFVWLQDDCEPQQAQLVGQQLAAGLNHWWKKFLRQEFNITSALEIEFETHYHQFLMPTIRGSTEGSKKRYAGMIEDNGESRLVFKGLETVRADWTELAKEFQQQLYLLVFNQQPYRDVIKKTVGDLLSGGKDQQLIYRKRLRRVLAAYQKSNPPHIKAAKKLSASTQKKLGSGSIIEYVITVNGPEPISQQASIIDYQHYIDKQLKPIADSILCFLDDNFDEIVQPQLSLL